jgi:phosphoglycerate dehydrogenase-like enzyme
LRHYRRERSAHLRFTPDGGDVYEFSFAVLPFPDAPEFLHRRLPPGAGDESLSCSDDNVRAMLDGVDVIIPKMHRIDRDILREGRFRLVQQWGAGIEGVDLDAARARDIWVSNVPASGGNAESVAEHAVLLILSLLRDLPTAQAGHRTPAHRALGPDEPIGRAGTGTSVSRNRLTSAENSVPLSSR